jgi:hypothetical protein
MMAIVDSNGDLVKPTEHLTEEQKKYIAEMLNEKYGNLSIENTIGFFEFIDMWKENLGILLKQVPEAEFVRVVRCKDCRIGKGNTPKMGAGWIYCENNGQYHKETHFCGYGERRSDE